MKSGGKVSMPVFEPMLDAVRMYTITLHARLAGGTEPCRCKSCKLSASQQSSA